MTGGYYTIQDVAEKIGKSQKTIRRHIAAKKLVASKIQNKWRILPEDFQQPTTKVVGL